MMITTRFAPSPTGFLHVGNLRTALFNYMIARAHNGCFILRLDDTDSTRSTQEYAQAIQEDLEWLGLSWDRIEKQSNRLDRYKQAAQDLRDKKRFYECFETPLELDLKRKKQLNMGKPPVYDRSALTLTNMERDKLRQSNNGHWRFMLELEYIKWHDGILGDLSINTASVSDPILIRGDGQFLYTLASVCDDIDFGITHVVRGADHVTNTATQIQIIRTLGGNIPNFAHHSLLTDPHGQALSKRLGALSIRDLRETGYEPMAVLSYIVRLGTTDPIKLYDSLHDLINDFDLSKFGAAPTKFNIKDMLPLSKRVIANLNYSHIKQELAALGIPDQIAPAFWDMVHENINTREDISKWWDICHRGAVPIIKKEDADFIRQAIALLPEKPWDAHTWKTWTTQLKVKTNRKGKALFMPLRCALTGLDHGPDMSKLLPLLENIKINNA